MNDKEVTRILVVEDNHIAQKIARLVIESLNCEFDIIDNGSYALQLFSENRYDLVFIDLGLPDRDGYSVASEMREMESKFSLTPAVIIGLSVHTGELQRMRAMNAGMNDYMVKPLTRENCQSALKKFLSSHTSKD
jgi:CheY-like chemotaxis protein